MNMVEDTGDTTQLQKLLRENQRLLKENNRLLEKMERRAKVGFWVRVATFLVIIGVPFFLYYYLIVPYFSSVSASFEIFLDGLQDVPGWRQFYGSMWGE